MPSFNSLRELLIVSLREYLETSKLALSYRKDASWQSDGCLGFASGVLLMCVVDTLGSFMRGTDVEISIDGQPRKIDGEGFKHFFVLNHADTFAQHLSHAEIKGIYDTYRSPLSHNAAVANDRGFVFDPENHEPFPMVRNRRAVNLPVLHNLCCTSAEWLIKKEGLETSRAAQILLLRTGA